MDIEELLDKHLPLLVFVNEDEDIIAEYTMLGIPRQGDTVRLTTKKGNVEGVVANFVWRITPIMRPSVWITLSNISVSPLYGDEKRWYSNSRFD